MSSGVTLKLWKAGLVYSPDEDQFKCLRVGQRPTSRHLADHLGIPFHLIDDAEEFQKEVISAVSPPNTGPDASRPTRHPDARYGHLKFAARCSSAWTRRARICRHGITCDRKADGRGVLRPGISRRNG